MHLALGPPGMELNVILIVVILVLYYKTIFKRLSSPSFSLKEGTKNLSFRILLFMTGHRHSKSVFLQMTD